MGQAVVRLLFISFFSCFCVAAIVFGLRMVTKDRYFQPFDHPLNSSSNWTVAMNALSPNIKPPSEEQILIAGAQVQQLADQSLVLWPKHYILTNGQNKFLAQIQPEDWAQLAPESLSLDQFLLNNALRPIFLEVNHPQILNVKAFYEKIKSSRDNDNVLIQTSSQGLKNSLKKLDPRWLYGATTAELGKFRLMSAFFLETTLETTYDFAVADEFTDRQISELNKRHIRPLVKFENKLVTAQPALQSDQ